MNPVSTREADQLFSVTSKASKDSKAKVIIAPPNIFLDRLSKQKLPLSAQNVYSANSGAFTGEISPLMLKKMGVPYVILGHSERRVIGEDDTLLNKKVIASLKAGLKVILCVGESDTMTPAKAKQFIARQLKQDLKKVVPADLKKIMIAYEPIWAIGTGQTATPEYANDICAFIKHKLGLNISTLYGGSVNSQNIKSFVQYQDIDGVLVGGASLKSTEVKNIIKNIK